MEKILVLAGYSAAGKSTIGKSLESHGYRFIEHQPLVHRIAKSKGFLRARYWLAQVGVIEFTRESTDEMVKIIKSYEEIGDDKVVLDVAYGREMLNRFKLEFPEAQIIVVAVIAEQNLRLQRIKRRMGTQSDKESAIELEFRDSFLRQAGLEEILVNPDLRLDNLDGIIVTISSLVSYLNSYGQ